MAAIIVKFLILGGLIAVATYLLFPERFLAFPRYNPKVWLMVMVLYPVMSVVVQELVFRTFFFHRYGPLFGGAQWLAILSNGAAFGFAHIIFGNVIAMFGSMFIGFLLAYRYCQTRSFWAVWLEHTLYGCLVFTVGLGWFFYTVCPTSTDGVANPIRSLTPPSAGRRASARWLRRDHRSGGTRS